MIVAAMANALLLDRGLMYVIAFLLQVGFYVVALAGAYTSAPLFRLPSFLVVANFAILTAWFRYVRGERFTIWNPSERAARLPDVASAGPGTFS
jgi:hypothetical protein